MSKQINRGLALLILFCLCVASLTTRLTTPGHAQAGAAATAQNAAIISTTDAVLKETL